jgi:putative endonuclease
VSTCAKYDRSGRLGEAVAARFLERRGGKILARNVRVGRGEIDLLVELGGEQAVVEVKSAWTDQAGDPAEAFTPGKARQVRSLAATLSPPVFRVDLVTVRFSDEGALVRWQPRAG